MGIPLWSMSYFTVTHTFSDTHANTMEPSAARQWLMMSQESASGKRRKNKSFILMPIWVINWKEITKVNKTTQNSQYASSRLLHSQEFFFLLFESLSLQSERISNQILNYLRGNRKLHWKWKKGLFILPPISYSVVMHLSQLWCYHIDKISPDLQCKHLSKFSVLHLWQFPLQ